MIKDSIKKTFNTVMPNFSCSINPKLSHHMPHGHWSAAHPCHVFIAVFPPSFL